MKETLRSILIVLLLALSLAALPFVGLPYTPMKVTGLKVTQYAKPPDSSIFLPLIEN